MKKFLLLSALFLLLFSANVQGIVYTGTCGRVQAYFKVDSANLLWHLDTETRILTITGSGPMRDYDSDWRAPWYQYRADFDTIWVSDSATSIGQYAFNDLWADSIHIGNAVEEVRDNAMSSSSFTSLVFPNATKQVGSYACRYNSRLKSVIFQDGTEIINYMCFGSCDSLLSVNFGNSRINVGPYSFYYCGQLHTVYGPKITNIDYYAFYYNTSLYNLNIGDTVQHIGDFAFRYCSSLPMFVLPASVTSIDNQNPLANCTNLDSISVDVNNPSFDSRNGCNAIMNTASNGLVSGCVNTIIPNNCTIILNYAFCGCERLTQITIPNSVSAINDNAFESCSGLLNVALSDNVSSIGCNAFLRCTGLLTPVHNSTLFARLPYSTKGIYTMPDGIVEITCGAIRDCDSLTSVILPQSLRRIQSQAFCYCTKLDTISIPKKVNTIESQAFMYCYSLRNINLPDSITLLKYGVFYYCEKLQSITIPDAVYNIESEAFRYCRSLKHVSIPANLYEIGSPFYGCDSLNSVVWNAKNCRWNDWGLQYYSIPDAINNRSYQNTAFYSVRHNIKSFVFGDSVKVIPRFLCYEMDSLTSINIPAEVDSIERCAFDYCTSVTSIFWNSRHCNSQISYVYSPFYTIRNSVNTFTFGDSVRTIPAYLCHGMSAIKQLHIPSLVTYIGPYAFRYLNQLDTIWVNNNYYDSRNRCNALLETASDSLIIGCWKTNIPQNTRAIGPYAFRNVRRLKYAVIPEGVTYVGEEAFNGCTDLDSVILPTKLTAIHDYTFQDCDSLRYLRMPDSLKTVGLRAFANCSKLTTLKLAETLTWMDDYSFSNCTGLLDIYCNAYNPPSITSNTFTGSTCPIYVPCAQVNTYRNAPNWYNLRSRINGQYYITFDARANDYSYGDVTILQEPNCEHSAKVVATPVAGYDFLGWVTLTGDTVSRDSLYEFIPTENTSLIGVFQKHVDPVYGITLIAKPDDVTHGSAVVVIAPNFNQNAEIEARAAAGYQFIAWTKDNGDTISKQKIYNFDPALVYNDGRDTVVVIAVFVPRTGIDNIDDTELSMRVWTEHETINVLTPENGTYYLYDMTGMLIDSAPGVAGETIQFTTPKPGIYIIKSPGTSVKVVTL